MLSVCAAALTCLLAHDASGGDPVTVRIDLGRPRQIIDNFGASDAWSMEHLGAWSEENRNRVADLLFSAEEGIGLSCWRFNIGGGINHDRIQTPWRTPETFEVGEGKYDWTRQAGARWFLRAAKARGVGQFVAFVNSPPGRMTRNGFTNCTDGLGTTNLQDGYEAQFARYVADILKRFRDHPDEAERIAFDFVSPVNEPNWEWNEGSQEGNRASNEDIRRIVRALYAELQRRGLRTRIMLPESGTYEALVKPESTISKEYGTLYGEYIREFCGDRDLAPMLAPIVCAHAYWSQRIDGNFLHVRARVRDALAAHPGWRLWQSEFCYLQGPEGEAGGGRDLSMMMALWTARLIHFDLTLAGATAWQWWTAVSNVDYKDGLIYTDYQQSGDAESIILSKNLWALGNFSRFIRPGARLVSTGGADDPRGLMVSAYAGGAHPLVVVIVNIGVAPRSVLFDFGDEKTGVSEWTPYVTSEAPEDNLRPDTPVSPREPLRVPGRSVVTLVAR